MRNSLTTEQRGRILGDMKPLGVMLLEWRTLTRRSKAEAARACTISQVQWTDLEAGNTSDPRASTLLKLASGTGIPLERLAAAAELQREGVPA